MDFSFVLGSYLAHLLRARVNIEIILENKEKHFDMILMFYISNILFDVFTCLQCGFCECLCAL